ncbi:MAG TPA: hypothetical protein PLQ13_01615 [Candidatus Krumholzibacteria bacterium]|nr:hypothetical protein [Candidatus Krumholzibacteria bacterium]
MALKPDYAILADELFTLEHADFCGVPGYLVLRVRSGAQSLGDLSTGRAQKLGVMTASAAGAIETIVKAERVYCLSFCEVDRGLHFHLFPRTSGLAAAWREAAGVGEDAPIDGAALFAWARATFPAGAALPAGFPTVAETCDKLRGLLDPA